MNTELHAFCKPGRSLCMDDPGPDCPSHQQPDDDLDALDGFENHIKKEKKS